MHFRLDRRSPSVIPMRENNERVLNQNPRPMRWPIQPIPCLQCNGQIILMHSILSILPAVVDGQLSNHQHERLFFPPSKTIGHQCCCSSTVLSNRRGCSSDSVCLRLRVHLYDCNYPKEPNVLRTLYSRVAGLTDAMILWIELGRFLCLLADLPCSVCSVRFCPFIPVRM